MFGHEDYPPQSPRCKDLGMSYLTINTYKNAAAEIEGNLCRKSVQNRKGRSRLHFWK